MHLMTFDPPIVTLFGVSHLGNMAKSVQECLLILISLVAPYAPKVPTLRKKYLSEHLSNKSRVEPTIFFIEKLSFSLKFFSGHFYGQSFIKTVRGPLAFVIMSTRENIRLIARASLDVI